MGGAHASKSDAADSKAVVGAQHFGRTQTGLSHGSRSEDGAPGNTWRHIMFSSPFINTGAQPFGVIVTGSQWKTRCSK